MTFSCRRATLLASNAMDRPLTQRERLALRFHLLICGYCRRFKKQILMLRQVLRGRALSATLPDSSEFVLDSNARARIRSALERST